MVKRQEGQQEGGKSEGKAKAPVATGNNQPGKPRPRGGGDDRLIGTPARQMAKKKRHPAAYPQKTKVCEVESRRAKVAELIGKGYDRRRIAAELGISLSIADKDICEVYNRIAAEGTATIEATRAMLLDQAWGVISEARELIDRLKAQLDQNLQQIETPEGVLTVPIDMKAHADVAKSVNGASDTLLRAVDSIAKITGAYPANKTEVTIDVSVTANNLLVLLSRAEMPVLAEIEQEHGEDAARLLAQGFDMIRARLPMVAEGSGE